MHLLEVNQDMTAAFHSSADDQAKKINQIIEIEFHCFLDDDTTKYSKWMNYLSILEYEYNSLIHSTTGFTPNELWFSTPICDISNLATSPRDSFETIEQLVENLKNARDDVHDAISLA